MADHAEVRNSLVYNGCKIDGTVRNSILFPGVHVKKGAIVENSVLFFSNQVGENCRLNKVVADVNNVFGKDVVIGPEVCDTATEVTVVGWNNKVPDRTVIGEGATVYPDLTCKSWPACVQKGEVLR
jgi:glucose-1-phosphate adenylyltransferase